MTVTWYIGKNVRDFSFTVPVLTDRRFQVADLPARFDPNQDLRIPIGNAQVVARKGHEELDGRQYLTVRFRKVLIPKQAGSFTLPRATVAGKALEGYRRGQRRSLFDDFFDDNFFNDKRRTLDIAETLARKVDAGSRPHCKIRWGTEATIHDTLKMKDHLPLVRKAGLWALWLGVEDMTGALVKKGQSADKTLEAFRLLRENGIFPVLFSSCRQYIW